jgi:hypothetical protein
MIQFNLLPDVKQQYLKAQSLKRIVIVFSFLITVIAIVVFVFLLLYVDFVQKQHINSLSTSIQKDSNQLKSNVNLDKILTIQNQLKTIPSLEAQKPVVSRLFTYMTKLTPAAASISNLSVDFTNNTIKIEGSADTLITVNQYVDTLKFTTYSADNNQSTNQTKAFSNVVLTFGYTQNNPNGKPVSYTIDLSFDPIIFSNAHSVSLNIPQITTTRSVLGQPTDLFQKANHPTSSSTGGKQ